MMPLASLETARMAIRWRRSHLLLLVDSLGVIGGVTESDADC